MTEDGYQLDPKDGDADPPATPDRSSLLDDHAGPDACPNCGVAMPTPDAVVCLSCGFDQKQNRIIKTKVGSEEVADPADAEFVRAGRLGFRVPLIAGVALTLAAAIFSGMHADTRAVLHGVATFLFAPVSAGIGVAAVMLTAALMEDRFGRLELAAARMLLAVGLVGTAWHAGQNLEAHSALRFLAGGVGGAGLYFLAVWWLFRLNRTVALLVGVMHLALWLIFRGLLTLEALLASPAPAP